MDDFVDELEKGIKDVAQTGQQVDQASQVDPKTGKKVDPVTGKTQPSKKMLTQLSQQVAQLAQTRLKKVREELEKQRLKIDEPAAAKAMAGETGPEVKAEEKKPKEDIVQKTLKASKSTGEFKGLIGG